MFYTFHFYHGYYDYCKKPTLNKYINQSINHTIARSHHHTTPQHHTITQVRTPSYTHNRIYTRIPSRTCARTIPHGHARPAHACTCTIFKTYSLTTHRQIPSLVCYFRMLLVEAYYINK